MTKVRTIPQITEVGTRALVRALGYADAVRFITALRPGRGDYTRERAALLRGVGAGEILAEVDRLQRERAVKSGRSGRAKRRSA